jgi:hypothetical protein
MMAEETKGPQKSARETYDTVADTIGLVPSVRLKDNVIQGITVVVVTGIAALVGFVMGGTTGLAVGALLGLVGSLLVSGTVLMVVGWVRAAKKLSK